MNSSLLQRLLAVVGFLWISSAANAAVGRTEGTWNVTDNGAATYTIPIFTPGGTARLAPTLAFTYSSDNGNGALSVGWGISGLSRIERCPSIVASNGSTRDVRGDMLDRFCLNGNQLKYFAGAAYGQAGSEYRGEVDDFSRIKAFGSAGAGPAYFIAEQKDGLIYEYGNSGDSRIEWIGSSTARAWAVNKIRDRSGNTILFNYTEDSVNGSYRISSIQYTGNPDQGIAPAYQVSFVYEPLPTGEIDSTFIANGLIKRTTRLDRVDVTHSSSLIRRYELTFESTLSSTSRSRLRSIQECAGSMIDCVPATTFSYTNGTNASTSQLSSISFSDSFMLPLDLNGDGRTDLVFSDCDFETGASFYKLVLANANGTYGPAQTSSNSDVKCQGTNIRPIRIDYNADGRDDIMFPSAPTGGTWLVALGTNQGLSSAINTNTVVIDAARSSSADVNGDGLDDLVWFDGQYVRYRAGQGGSLSSMVGTLSSLLSDSIVFINRLRYSSRNQRADFNGDGREDLMLDRVFTATNLRTMRIILSGSSPTEMDIPGQTYNAKFVDLNGDGLSDVFYYVLQDNIPRYRFSRGSSFGPELIAPSTMAGFVAEMDWDGDGFDDIVSVNSSQQLGFFRSTGESLQSFVPFTPLTQHDSFLVPGDVNGDGLIDVILPRVSFQTVRHEGPAPDLLVTATDGFGVGATFSYASTGDSSVYQRQSGSVSPMQDFSGPMYVVSNVQASNGIGGTYNLRDFLYQGARVDLGGRGFLGFGSRSWVDSRIGVAQKREYYQAFPLIGAVKKAQSVHVSTNTTFNEVVTTYQTNASGGPGEVRHLTNASVVAQTDRELGGAYNGNLVRTSTTTNTMDWTTGTVYDSVTVITEAASANGLNPGQSYTIRRLLPLASLFTDTTHWCIGQPQEVQQLNSHTLFGGESKTRTLAATWDGLKCRPTQTVVEPGSATLQVTTDLGYDVFGNPSSASQTPVGQSVRASQLDWGTDGRFPRTLTNALSQTSSLDWWPELGLLKSVTDPNGLMVTRSYDGFGRQVMRQVPDGTSTLTEYLTCDVDCTGFANTKYKMRSTLRNTANATIAQGFALFDAFDRPRRSSSYALEGGLINRLIEYNAAGQVSRTSTPYFNAIGSAVWTTFQYDPMGRQTQATRDRVSDSDASTAVSTTRYDGLSVTSTDPQGKVRVDALSALGQIVQAIQAFGTGDQAQASYDYDAFGNLVRTTDSANNQITIGYNIRGFKSSSSDPDMGNWTYDYYPTGELKTQTDAKLQVTTFTYDKLSRPLTRIEPSDSGSGMQTTTWTWGASAANFNIGQMQSVVLGTYSETYAYDNRSRLSATTIVADGGTYNISNTYNSLTGFLETVTYPASTGATRLKVQYLYDTANKSGLVTQVKDFNAATVFWQATSSNAFGQYQDITLGNGLKTLTAYDSITGAINRIETGTSLSGTDRQNLQYVWDKVGNLTSRRDVNINKTETFTHDNLYRLTQAAVTGAPALMVAYNAIGNITSKSDVGTYTYNATKKHAVASAGSFAFTYDANGNAITQNGATIGWTAYNLPKLINRTGGNNSQFLYGPGRQRYKHVAVNGATTETTIYAGGIFEKLTRSGTNEFKHSILGPDGVVAIHNRMSTGVNTTIYPLQDHLGSTDLVTNSSGASLVKLSFTPFGARRNGATWSGAPTAADLTAIGNTTRRGFTEHEQLDNLELVHMNGRVYHPVIGRFISADPFVQAPFDTQSLNRYSYVFNNPLSFTDPSGFSREEPGEDGSVENFRQFKRRDLNSDGGGDSGGGACNLCGGGGTSGQTPQSDPNPPPSPAPVPPQQPPTNPTPEPTPEPGPTMGPQDPPMMPDLPGQPTQNEVEAWMGEVVIVEAPRIPVPGTLPSIRPFIIAFARVTSVVGALLYPSSIAETEITDPVLIEGAGDNVMMAEQKRADKTRKSKPKNAPPGTKPIDQVGFDKDTLHGIKEGIGAGPEDYVGVSPSGELITTNPDGTAQGNGNVSDYIN